MRDDQEITMADTLWWTPQQIDAFIIEQIKKGRIYKEIAATLGIHPSTVASYAQRLGVSKRDENNRRARDEFIIEHVKKGWTYKQIAEALGLTVASVTQHGSRLGVSQYRSHTPVPLTRRSINRVGVKFGAVSPAVEPLSDDLKSLLIRETSKSGLTVSEYLVKFWQEKHS